MAIGVELSCVNSWCFTDENTRCDDIIPHVSSVGLLMADHVFDLAPETYLQQWDEGCEVLIEKNTLPDGFDQIYLVGDTFLAHYYSVYNSDRNSLSLGVNTHSSNVAKITPMGDLMAVE